MTDLETIANDMAYDMVPDDWADCILEDEVDKLREMGFLDAEISWSGFWCQGDGASFTCRNIDFKAYYDWKKKNNQWNFSFRNDYPFLEEEDKQMWDDMGLSYVNMMEVVINDGFFEGNINRDDTRYVHYNSVSLCMDVIAWDYPEGWDLDSDSKELTQLTDYFQSDIEDTIEEESKKIYNILEKAYEAYVEEVTKEIVNNPSDYGVAVPAEQ